MNERAKNNWILAAVMTAFTLVPAGMVTAVLIGARGADPPDARTPRSAAQSADIPVERVSAPVTVQSPLDMTQQHHAMMDQMRASVSATMNQLMNSDPMWQMMRSSALIADLEKHEQEIDLMLARGG